MTDGHSEEAPRISVVVPVYQSAEYVGDCVRALLRQEVDVPFEILAIDNGSTDGSRELLESLAGITVLGEAERGSYAARNAGVRRARGDVIAFTDADCAPAADWLQSAWDALADPRLGAVVGRVRYPRSASVLLHLLGAYESSKAAWIIGRCPREYHFGYTNNMAVRAALFGELGPFEHWQRAADSEFVHRIAQRRPELGFAYRAAMQVTHLEFTEFRARARRLSLYAETNAQIPTFRELGLRHRLAALCYMLVGGGR